MLSPPFGTFAPKVPKQRLDLPQLELESLNCHNIRTNSRCSIAVFYFGQVFILRRIRRLLINKNMLEWFLESDLPSLTVLLWDSGVLTQANLTVSWLGTKKNPQQGKLIPILEKIFLRYLFKDFFMLLKTKLI